MSGKFRVLLVPDSIYWVTGTIARSIAAANPWIDATIVSGPLLGDVFGDADEIARRFDLVHFICPYASRDWLPRLRSKVPVVTSHHHVTSWDLIRHNLHGDAIVAGSAEWVKDLETRGADMRRVFRVPYGVDVDLFLPPQGNQREAMRRRLGLAGAEPVVGFFAKRASNDDDRKGTDIFGEALTEFAKMHRRTGVLIVGPGWQELVQRFRSGGIRCAWIPFIEDSSDIPALYHALDFYWVTARVEGGPVPLLEAMSCEVCCLSTEVGLAREVVKSGVNALLLPMNDARAFVDETGDLWSDDARRTAMGRAARETMKTSMRADEMARLVRPVYERAIHNFSDRNPASSRVTLLQVSEGAPLTGDSLVGSLGADEKRRVAMLEALAWSENLVLYENQRGAALKLIVRAWRENPGSLMPFRVLLRRFLPGPVTRGIVRLKHFGQNLAA
ncbi:MAG TPA: glycosyltransferase family 4 protein [Gemmatimonadaceae bacterium]|nr:glycosyltransferase family 4 protein [Gemmatimonadaceae bacterium]